ncbi:MAG: hypothetical protein ACTJHT_05905 [Sphingobacterium sp.]|uniref:hypothetical protein n=1 Tax=Sphingobacterium sp. JB170 TaxID=1434842 RepID=UPI00097E8659|nr:hypothetical protein [Sphingobacterium sp. JB170]SJN30720.1 hypothetical protein FM107_06565 [Sphingobacterium sp. JB170]
MKNYKTRTIFLLCFLCSIQLPAQIKDSTSFFYKIMPSNVKIQYAGNIGMFSAGIGYQTKNKKWKADLFYGVVPSKYADSPIHSVTLKGKYATLYRKYEKQNIAVNWLNVGMFYNYSFGDKYFLSLPHHYDNGYYYFPTALNVSIFIGSEARINNWGIYYELGATDKRVINYVKNASAVDFSEMWNLGIGIVYHLK